MVDAPVWFVLFFDFLLLIALFGGLIFIKAWLEVRRTRGKIVAEIWEPNGDTKRELVAPDPSGDTVIVNKLVYRLPRELSNEEQEKLEEKGAQIYPRKRWTFRNNWPLPPIPMRVESWERNNPEPIRPFYGRVTKDGKFDASCLTVTSTEWTAQKSVIQATSIAMSIQEREAREKEWTRAMANLPNKMIMYIGLGAVLLLSIIGVYLTYQMAMG